MSCSYCNSTSHTLSKCKKITPLVEETFDLLIKHARCQNFTTQDAKTWIASLDIPLLKRLVVCIGGIEIRPKEECEQYCYTVFRNTRRYHRFRVMLNRFQKKCIRISTPSTKEETLQMIPASHSALLFSQPTVVIAPPEASLSECCICLGSNSDTCYVDTNCGHSFCNCILHHVVKNGVKCPLCRKAIHTLTYNNSKKINEHKMKILSNKSKKIYFQKSVV